VVLRYVPASEASPLQPNPNGSANHIAGISNAAGTVVGIMPHPERVAENLLGSPDGLGFFASLAAWQPRASTLNVPSR
jgi:phosphoribosylformylglycinamidine synthase